MRVLVALRGTPCSRRHRPLRHPNCKFEQIQLNVNLFAWAWVITVADIQELSVIVMQNHKYAGPDPDDEHDHVVWYTIHHLSTIHGLLVVACVGRGDIVHCSDREIIRLVDDE